MGKIVSFATQKGGSGKSTLTLLLSTCLAVDYKLKIAVLDCDYQQSIVKTRIHMDAPNLEQLRETDPEADYPYDIFPMAMTKIFDFIDDPENDKYDLVILDLPGRADGNEIFDALTACDVVFVPLVSDYLDRASTADFMGILHSIKSVADKEGIAFDYYGLSTKRTNRREDREMDEYIDEIGLSRLKSSLGLRAAYSRPSTLFSLLNPAYLRYAGGDRTVSEEIKTLCEEIIEKLELPVNQLKPAKMNQPNKFSIKKPRITLSEEQKKQARSGMAGEAVKASEETTPDAPTPETTPSQPVAPILTAAPAPATAALPAPEPEPMPEEITPIPSRQGRGRGRKPEKNIAPVVEDSETQHVRMSKDAVMRAKMNVLLLPSSMGIRSLRDYGDAAFEFYEAHLRKTGKLPNR